jgi:hypothetical protein
VRPIRLRRSEFAARVVEGLVLARDVRDASGRVGLSKGTLLDATHASRLCDFSWDELHLIAAASDELHETDAGTRLSRAVSGPHVRAGTPSGGHWPLAAERRGVLAVGDHPLRELNRLNGVAVYTLYDGQVVDAGEIVGRAKIVPFVIGADIIERAEAISRAAAPVLAVRPFSGAAVGAVVQESLGARAMTRFRDALQEKILWFASRLIEPRFVAPDAAAIAAAVRDVVAAGATIVLVAGSRPMDPLDPMFDALSSLDARLEREGVPAHPGSLLWLARLGEIPIVGMPSCGLFSRATVFDLVLSRLLADAPVDGEWLSGLGHGGFLTRDMAFRFPRYRPEHERGEVT